ncbi:MAG: endonuclease/exonuclease/phosphatase family protein [Chloroflexi bacterium]|nr:endonuclease/exonuclease/phosphatase family protein [Chloroflexota bacterium]
MTQTIRFCTWNIQLGLQLETILRAIQTHADFAGIDMLALQEASIHSDRPDAEMIAHALGPSYQCFQVTAHFLGKYAQANALVWNSNRFRVSSRDTVILPRVRELKLPRAERAILCALPEQQRISSVLEGTIGTETLRVYVAHLDVLGVEHKREQFFKILSDARTRQPVTDLTIIAGDLNTFKIHSRPTWTKLAAEATREGFDDLTTEILWTHQVRRVRFHQKLDAIFLRHTRPFEYRSWSLDIPGSDHIPVFAEIKLI